MRYWIGRVIEAIPVLIGISIIFHLAPGDPVALVVDPTVISASEKAAIIKSLGLDKPLPIQYVDMMKGLLDGRLRSFRSKQPTIDVVRRALPITALLGGASLLVGFILGVPLGMFAATHPRGIVDRIVSMTLAISLALPTYILGLALVLLFSYRWKLLPSTGLAPLGVSGFTWPGSIRYLILPVSVLAFGTMATVARYLRDSMHLALQEDYVRTARAKGVREQWILSGHVLRNAFIPIIGLLNSFVPTIFGGSVLIENLFGIPGLGRVATSAAISRDYPVVMTTVMGIGVLTISANLLVDAIYTIVDPRVRLK